MYLDFGAPTINLLLQPCYCHSMYINEMRPQINAKSEWGNKNASSALKFCIHSLLMPIYPTDHII